MAKLVSRADLSRLAGVSRTTITRQCRARLAVAMRGERVDVDHPAVTEYLRSRASATRAVPDIPAPLARYLDLSLRELIALARRADSCS